MEAEYLQRKSHDSQCLQRHLPHYYEHYLWHPIAVPVIPCQCDLPSYSLPLPSSDHQSLTAYEMLSRLSIRARRKSISHCMRSNDAWISAFTLNIMGSTCCSSPAAWISWEVVVHLYSQMTPRLRPHTLLPWQPQQLSFALCRGPGTFWNYLGNVEVEWWPVMVLKGHQGYQNGSMPPGVGASAWGWSDVIWSVIWYEVWLTKTYVQYFVYKDT